MKTAEQWLKERCHSLKGVTPETVREIQGDAVYGTVKGFIKKLDSEIGKLDARISQAGDFSQWNRLFGQRTALQATKQWLEEE